jgi:disulfide bond formation protein DsbB
MAVSIIIFGILWIFGQTRWWNWFEPVSLFAVFTSAALGLYMNISVAFMLPGALLGFLAWDLAAFTGRLHLAAEDDDTSRLEGIHLRRMTVHACQWRIGRPGSQDTNKTFF